MTKMMIFLKRRADLSRDAFARWWLESHRPLAERLPGLLRHTFNRLPDSAPFDAVVEQWFGSAAAAAAAYACPEGEAVARDSAAHVSERFRVEVEDHEFELAGALDNARRSAATK